MNRSFLFRSGMRVAAWIALMLCRTYRVRIANPEALESIRRGNFVLAFWHGSMVMGWYLHRPRLQGRLPMHALVSRSKDGEYLSAVLERWGYSLIRGSSHRGGKEAMQSMIDEVKKGARLLVTPDGPTGPPHVMKIGAVRAAQQAPAPLLLASIFADKKFQFRSWDRFEVPYPFSKVSVRYIGPMRIDPALDGESLDRKLREIESAWQEADSGGRL